MKKQAPKIKKVKVTDLIPDDRNFNKGTIKGKELIKKSFLKFGAGRSVLVDKNNRLIAGNKATENFIEGGGKSVLIVEADRDTLIAVKRNDIDLDTAEGREFSLADNQTQKVDFLLDIEVLQEMSEQLQIDIIDWGVEPSFDDSATAEGEENTSSKNLMYLVIDNKKIPITDEERTGLYELLKMYVDSNTSSIGFAKYLIDAAKNKAE